MLIMKRILCFGDSITWGFDPLNEIRFPEEDRWPMILQEILGSGYRIIEEGQGGRTIATDDPAEGEKNGIRYIIPCLESHSPLDLVIIMLGTNDCKLKFSYSSLDIAGEMRRFLEKVVTYNRFHCADDFKILLVSPPVISDSLKHSRLDEIFSCGRAKAVSSGLASYYRELADAFGCSFLDAAQFVKTSEVDGIHLDASAQRTLGKVIAEKTLAMI